MDETLGILGSGTIACGLATAAADHGEVVLWARSAASADRARARVDKRCTAPESVQIVTDLDAVGAASFVIEAVAEDAEIKRPVLEEIGRHAPEQAVLATTTSSLPVEALAQATGRPDRFCAFHVFNPVPKMRLVELSFPSQAVTEVRDRATALCHALGKTPVEVPDVPGFVVNRLLFPFLFSAVRLMEETGLSANAVDDCMQLGAGHPMGPLALLDLVGLDVSAAIGETIGADVPSSLRDLIGEGALGRKAGRGFHVYV
ncbi:MAG TPA: 3-hydroxyacyl-CoA dehydrogenase family protein [Solirubrobacteraceae bacterium]